MSQIKSIDFCIFNYMIKILVKCWVWFSKVQNQNLKVEKTIFKIANLNIQSVKNNNSKMENQVLKMLLSYLWYWKSATIIWKVVISKAKVHFWNLELALLEPDIALQKTWFWGLEMLIWPIFKGTWTRIWPFNEIGILMVMILLKT